MCRNLFNQYPIDGKHLLKSSGCTLAVDMPFVHMKEGSLFHSSFIQNPAAANIIQLGPQHLANTSTKQSIHRAGSGVWNEKSFAMHQKEDHSQ